MTRLGALFTFTSAIRPSSPSRRRIGQTIRHHPHFQTDGIMQSIQVISAMVFSFSFFFPDELPKGKVVSLTLLGVPYLEQRDR